jgi:hypothetical protein
MGPGQCAATPNSPIRGGNLTDWSRNLADRPPILTQAAQVAQVAKGFGWPAAC